MSTNFRQSVNDYFGLDTNATATDRKNALRRASLAQIKALCESTEKPDLAYPYIRFLIQPDAEYDITYGGDDDLFPNWAPGMKLATVHIGKRGGAAWKDAEDTLNEWFNTCYPPTLEAIPVHWSFIKTPLIVHGLIHLEAVTNGADFYSAMKGIQWHERWLASQLKEKAVAA